jgi:hypothetical protein
MTVAIDEAMVREFVTIISAHAVELAKGKGNPGVLQLCCLSPANEKMIPHRFRLDDIDAMVRTAIGAASAMLNVYLEARTLRAGLRGAARGELTDTELVFGLVVDSDSDKGRGGVVAARPSLVIETSPGNYHYWYLLSRPIAWVKARALGDAIRAATGADVDTGVVTQCYRVAGTPNFPSKAKQARGRATVEPTRIVEWTGRLWDPEELLEAFTAQASVASVPPAPSPVDVDESSLPPELLEAIRAGGVSKGAGAKGDKSKSGLWHHVIGELKKRNWTLDQIHALLERHPNGVGAKYAGRLREEIARSYAKVENGSPAAAAPLHRSAGGSGGLGGGSSPPPPTSGGPGASAPAHILPTIRLVDGQLPRAVSETERAMIGSGAAIFARAGYLVYPTIETVMAADGAKTIVARLSEFTTDSFIEPVAESAIYQRWSVRRKTWVDVDPPLQLVRMVLSRERRWAFPKVSGVITTPTLRADGSLLSSPGYDSRTELYLWPGFTLPPIPQSPTQAQALAELTMLKEELFAEFSFKQRKPAIDLSVALAGLLTALLRGSLPTAPVILVRADTPGTGKSYLVDVISMVATGQLCPVITTSRSFEETEKRIGSVLLSGSGIVSLDNLAHDLEGEILCQVAERSIVRIRILGRSEMPLCECRTALFATGNNVGFKGDMVRRGLVCDLEALDARPELREFHSDALARAQADRGRYVAAALTVVRAYIVAGSPQVCKPFGSYYRWSTLVRSPLVWLGETDPIGSVETIRQDDAVLADIAEFFGAWETRLKLDTSYTTTRIIEIADAPSLNNFNSPDLRNFLLRVAAAQGSPGNTSPERLGRWLRKISGRIVGGRRLIRARDSNHVTTFRLVKA